MTMSDAGKATFFRLLQLAKAEALILTVPSSKLRSLSELKPENACSPISTFAGILRLDGCIKQQKIVPV
jgi:hypothetical protein